MKTLVTGDGSATAVVGGAITIVNATATGLGCALGTEAGLTASWTWGPPGTVQENPRDWFQGCHDTRVAEACRTLARTWPLPTAKGVARAETCGAFPPARGLKTSSQSAAALVAAARAAAGLPWNDQQVTTWSVEVARSAGVTLTGAFDDHTAVTRGGCHITDNRGEQGKVLRRIEVPLWHVAVWVPNAAIEKTAFRDIDLTPARPGAEEALGLAREGDLAAALEANHGAYFPCYEAAGLPVDEAPVRAARLAGALAAGITGTGPAVSALFASPVALPAVPGGTWHWTRVRDGGAP